VEIKTAIDGPSGLVRITGELDAETAPALEEALRLASERGATELVADFSGVSFIDSSGLSVLVASHKRLQRLGGTLVIAAPSAPVRRLFDIAGLDRVLTIDE
jgi:anti-sigma B factor antagonist